LRHRKAAIPEVLKVRASKWWNIAAQHKRFRIQPVVLKIYTKTSVGAVRLD
jgi:hypothetical protein